MGFDHSIDPLNEARSEVHLLWLLAGAPGAASQLATDLRHEASVFVADVKIDSSRVKMIIEWHK
jgi:hypothetical protein